jgi:hypothetical protein
LLFFDFPVFVCFLLIPFVGTNPFFDFFAFFDADGEPLVVAEFVGPLDGDIVGTG